MQFENDELLAIYHAIMCYLDQHESSLIYEVIRDKLYDFFTAKDKENELSKVQHGTSIVDNIDNMK